MREKIHNDPQYLRSTRGHHKDEVARLASKGDFIQYTMTLGTGAFKGNYGATHVGELLTLHQTLIETKILRFMMKNSDTT